jgi:cell pole-organizing protein PopZ
MRWGKQMGDLSREPSMEEILTSIKRIIAEEGEEAVKAAPRAQRRARVEPLPEASDEAEEILELTNPVEESQAAQPQEAAAAGPARVRAAISAAREAVTQAGEEEGMLSAASEISARHSLATLSTMLVKPQAGEDNTLDGLVRNLLRPMLKDWLDANLPALVEEMVGKEIARITAR